MSLNRKGSDSNIQTLVASLLNDIYGKVTDSCYCINSLENHHHRWHRMSTSDRKLFHENSYELKKTLISDLSYGNVNTSAMEMFENRSFNYLLEITSTLQFEIKICGVLLGRHLVTRDRLLRKRQQMFDVITAHLKAFSNKSAEVSEMRFSFPPPPPTISHSTSSSSGGSSSSTGETPLSMMGITNTTSDFNQWLHAMKMVARLPGGMPPEFRKKLWLALADRYLLTRNVDWSKEQVKCLSDQWRADDEELGVQIVKDLHRTGSSLCSGPAGSLNQAKLKRVLLGYARWNPEVGYCQGFNMLGALILQVLDKNEADAIKVMICLVEGVLPPGYFSGSLGGLQADMAVFRELLSTRLPKLAKHLQKLQGPLGEGSFEPPLTNVFTMQWFLTLFCTCLPINCVLRVWDLVLIEGSDVLLRTALAIWGLLENRIIGAKTADDFYCKMGTLSGELLNGSLIDSNGLVQRVVDLGPIPDLQKMRDKHLYNIAPWRDKKGLKLYYSDDEGDSDDDSRMAVATAWGIRVGRRGSLGLPSNHRPPPDCRDRLALDINLLKQQYERLRERQRQAHIILTAACARQTVVNPSPAPTLQMNQLLLGRNAILSNKGRRIGPPQGAIPPIRKTGCTTKPKSSPKQPKRGETLHWKDTEEEKKRRNSIKWKDIEKKETDDDDDVEELNEMTSVSTTATPESTPTHQATTSKSRRRSESSSYSEESDANSSTSTSLCDDDNISGYKDSGSSLEASPFRKKISPEIEVPEGNKIDDIKKYIESLKSESDKEIEDETIDVEIVPEIKISEKFDETESEISSNLMDLTDDILPKKNLEELEIKITTSENIDKIIKKGNSDGRDIKGQELLAPYKAAIKRVRNDDEKPPNINIESMATPCERYLSSLITSTSQLSPIADISRYLTASSISPLKTPSSTVDYSEFLTNISRTTSPENLTDKTLKMDDSDFNISEEGVTNQLFDRIILAERPNKLDIPDYTLKRNNMNRPISEIYTTDNSFRSIDHTVRSVSQNPIDVFQTRSPSFSIELPTSHTDSPIIPSCTDISNITAGRSPLIHENSMESLAEGKSVTMPSDSGENEFDLFLSNRIRCLKEKSLSLDESSKAAKKIKPTSCPEQNEGTSGGRRNSDRALKIIQENSMILTRILKKNSNDDQLGDFKEDIDKMLLSPSPITPGFDQHEMHVKEFEKTAELNKIVEDDDKKEEDIFESLPVQISSQPKSLATVESPLTFERKTTPVKETRSPVLEEVPLPEKLNKPETLFDNTNTTSISETISSIENTIKSINSLCQDREMYSHRSRRSRILDDVDDIIISSTPTRSYSKENLEMSKSKSNDNDENKFIEIDKENYTMTKISPSFKIEEIDDQSKMNVMSNYKSESNKLLPTIRGSRDKSRDPSPRRRRDEEKEEYESRVRRDHSPSYLVKDFSRVDRSNEGITTNLEEEESCKKDSNDDHLKSFSYDHDSTVKSSYLDKNLNDSTAFYGSSSSSSSHKKYPEKLEIRHTTVTSTLYDRYLSQKNEKTGKLDKSPSSPVITRSYLESLKPISDRITKSAENSPSRQKTDITESSSISPTRIESSYCGDRTKNNDGGDDSERKLKSDNKFLNDFHIRSCDNIPNRLKEKKENNTIIKSDPFYSHLPIKMKPPSELGIKLGLYKSPTKQLPDKS